MASRKPKQDPPPEVTAVDDSFDNEEWVSPVIAAARAGEPVVFDMSVGDVIFEDAPGGE